MSWMVPNSKPGWWAGWMLLGVAACWVAMGSIVGFLQRGDPASPWQPAISVVGIIGILCILGAFAAGIAAFVHKDRSAPVWVALVIGVLSAWVLVGVIVTP